MAATAKIPETAKRKVLRDEKQETIVWLDPRPGGFDGRRFDVYNADGDRLGFIEEYRSRITSPIRGTRMVTHGKERAFWAVNGRDYWRHLPSQTAAIRSLIQSVGR